MADEKAIASSGGSSVASTAAHKSTARLCLRILVWRLMGRRWRSSTSLDSNVEPKEDESEQPESVDAVVEEEEKKDEPKEEVSEHSGSADANAEPVGDTNKVEKVDILVPIEKVGWILGKAGEPIFKIYKRSRAGIELIQPNPSDVEQKKEWICRITGNKKQTESAREMVKDIMNQTCRKPREFSQHQRSHQGQPVEAPYQGPAQTYGPPPQQQYLYAPASLFFLPTWFGPTGGFGLYPQAPQPAANNVAAYGYLAPVYLAAYGALPPYQGPAQTYPDAPSGPVQQQTYPNPPYPFYPPAAAFCGYGQPVAGYPEPAAPIHPATYAAQPTQAHQPGWCDQQ